MQDVERLEEALRHLQEKLEIAENEARDKMKRVEEREAFPSEMFVTQYRSINDD